MSQSAQRSNENVAWSESQRRRLATEKSIIDRYMPDAKWEHPSNANKTYVEWTYRVKSSKKYTLRVYLGANFPTACPILCMASPKKLKRKDGSVLKEPSHYFHTLGMYDGLLRLCHYRPDLWTADETIYKVRRMARAVAESGFSRGTLTRRIRCFSRVRSGSRPLRAILLTVVI